MQTQYENAELHAPDQQQNKQEGVGVLMA